MLPLKQAPVRQMKTVIDSSDKARLNLQEVFSYSDLLKNLAFRDITIRYKQTWLGILWALVKPTFNIAVFGVISMLITKSNNPSESFLTVGAGVIIWNLMTSCITESSNSLIANSNLLTKVYFPKLILPVSSIMVCLIDFTISFTIYLIMFIIFKGLPGPQFLLFPLFVILAVTLCLGVGLIFSALNVKYRDVNFALPLALQFAYYVSPVFLTTAFYLQHLPNYLRPVFLLNPAVFILDGFRYCLYGTWEFFDFRYVSASLVVMIILLFFGVRNFLKFEKSFADHI